MICNCRELRDNALMNEATMPLKQFAWLGGHPVLDFINTLANRFGENPDELIVSYFVLVDFCEQAHFIDEAQAQSLRKAGEREAAEAAVVLRRALRLREALFHAMWAIVENRQPPEESLALVNEGIAKILSHRRIGYSDAGFAWLWRDTVDNTPDQIMWPLLWEAAMFMTSGELARMKICPAPDGCGCLFFDRSKNRSRRWCSMKHCGNTAKARRQNRRRQGQPT